MKSMTTLFFLEIYRHRWLFAAALLLGFLPYLVLPQPVSNLGKGLASVTQALPYLGGLLTALFVGARLLVPDLKEGRLGFFLRRPMPLWTLWAGKMAAAGCVCWLVMILLALPSVVFTGDWALVLSFFSAGMLLPIFMVMASSHAVAVGLGARSPWFLLDLVLASALAILILRSEPFFTISRHSAGGAERWMRASFWGVLIAALLVAGLVQLCYGRTDLRRGHRKLSLTLWGILLPLALGMRLVSASLEPTPLGRLDSAFVLSPPWVFVEGLNRAGEPTAFFVHSMARHQKLLDGRPAAPPMLDEVSGRAAWIEDPVEGGPPVLRSMQLKIKNPEGPQPRPWSLALTDLAPADQRRAPAAFALALAGKRAAVWVDGALRVLDEKERGSSVEVQVSARAVALEFWDAETLLIFAARGGDGAAPYLELLQLHGEPAQLSTVARYDAVEDLGALRTTTPWSLDPKGRTDGFVLRHGDREELGLYRKDDGTRLAWLGLDADPETGVYLSPTMVAVLVDSGTEAVVHFFDPEGNRRSEFPIGHCAQGQLGAGSGGVFVGCQDHFVRLSSGGIVSSFPRAVYPLPYRRVPGDTTLPQSWFSFGHFDRDQGLVHHYDNTPSLDFRLIVPVVGLKNPAPPSPPRPESPTP